MKTSYRRKIGAMDDDGDDEATTDERGGRPLRHVRLAPGRNYRVLGTIGHGGMGEVVAAHDDVLDRGVAIKRLLDADPAPAHVARFLREARIQARLDHPAIPPVHELARGSDGLPYFVMKRLTGISLSKVLAGRAASDAVIAAKFPDAALLRAFANVCLAMELAHTHGVIHRDLKPANIMLGDFGEVYVIDWGVAKVIGDTDPELATMSDASRDPSATQAGTVVGTPAYMAPEQRGGRPDVDGRADVYALGRILFDILAGIPQVPPELDKACALAMADDRDARLATARELAERVQRYLDGDRDLALRRKLAAEHLVRARGARKSGDGVIAMREAGRALALDPGLHGAAELITRLMLEPPTETPREVADQIRGEEDMASRQAARTAINGYLAYFAFIAYFVSMGIKQPGYLVAMGLLVGSALTIAIVNVRQGITRLRAIAMILCNAALFGVLARVLTPFTIVPGLASVTIIIMCTSPAYRSRQLVGVAIAAFSAAIWLPYLGELVGAWSRTVTFSDGLMHLASALEQSTAPSSVGLLLFAFAFIAFSAQLALRMARSQAESTRRLHLQAWRLRQLVPTES